MRRSDFVIWEGLTQKYQKDWLKNMIKKEPSQKYGKTDSKKSEN